MNNENKMSSLSSGGGGGAMVPNNCTKCQTVDVTESTCPLNPDVDLSNWDWSTHSITNDLLKEALEQRRSTRLHLLSHTLNIENITKCTEKDIKTFYEDDFFHNIHEYYDNGPYVAAADSEDRDAEQQTATTAPIAGGGGGGSSSSSSAGGGGGGPIERTQLRAQVSSPPFVVHPLDNELFKATRRGILEDLKQAYLNGGEVNARDRAAKGTQNRTTGWQTPLYYACGLCPQNLACISFLLEKGADVNVGDKSFHRERLYHPHEKPPKDDKCPLTNAISHLIVRYHFNSEITTNTLIQSRKVVQILLEQPGLIVDNEDIQGRTPLHYACLRCRPDIVPLLVKAGADPYRPNLISGRNSMIYAAASPGFKMDDLYTLAEKFQNEVHHEEKQRLLKECRRTLFFQQQQQTLLNLLIGSSTQLTFPHRFGDGGPEVPDNTTIVIAGDDESGGGGPIAQWGRGGGSTQTKKKTLHCKLCGAPKVTQTTCPLKVPKAKNPKPKSHNQHLAQRKKKTKRNKDMGKHGWLHSNASRFPEDVQHHLARFVSDNPALDKNPRVDGTNALSIFRKPVNRANRYKCSYRDCFNRLPECIDFCSYYGYGVTYTLGTVPGPGRLHYKKGFQKVSHNPYLYHGPYAREPVGTLPLHVACSNGNNRIVRHLLQKRNTNVNIYDMEGTMSPLHLAVSQRNIECVRSLLKAGANPNASCSMRAWSETGKKPCDFLFTDDSSFTKVYLDDPIDNNIRMLILQMLVVHGADLSSLSHRLDKDDISDLLPRASLREALQTQLNPYIQFIRSTPITESDGDADVPSINWWYSASEEKENKERQTFRRYLKNRRYVYKNLRLKMVPVDFAPHDDQELFSDKFYNHLYRQYYHDLGLYLHNSPDHYYPEEQDPNQKGGGGGN